MTFLSSNVFFLYSVSLSVCLSVFLSVCLACWLAIWLFGYLCVSSTGQTAQPMLMKIHTNALIFASAFLVNFREFEFDDVVVALLY